MTKKWLHATTAARPLVRRPLRHRSISSHKAIRSPPTSNLSILHDHFWLLSNWRSGQFVPTKLYVFLPRSVTNSQAQAEADSLAVVEHPPRRCLQAQQMAQQLADLLAAIQDLRNAVEALNDQLVELQGKMPRIERRRAGKMLAPWVPIVAV